MYNKEEEQGSENYQSNAIKQFFIVIPSAYTYLHVMFSEVDTGTRYLLEIHDHFSHGPVFPHIVEDDASVAGAGTHKVVLDLKRTHQSP